MLVLMIYLELLSMLWVSPCSHPSQKDRWDKVRILPPSHTVIVQISEKSLDFEVREKYTVDVNQSLTITSYTRVTDEFKKVAEKEIKERKAVRAKLIMYCDEHKEVYQADVFPEK